MQNVWLNELQAGIKIGGINIHNPTSDVQMITLEGQKAKRN